MTPEQMMAEGTAHFAAGRLPQALQLFRQYCQQSPQDPNGFHNLAAALQSVGRVDEAKQGYRDALRLNPNLPLTIMNLAILELDANPEEAKVLASRILHDQTLPLHNAGMLFARCGFVDEAKRLLRQSLAANSSDPNGSSLILAALDRQTLPHAPAAYLRNLYDRRAPRYDVRYKMYRGAEMTARALQEAAPSTATVLDLGCGTGMVGQQIRQSTSRLVGVDLSPKMIAVLSQKNLYDELYCDGLMHFLTSQQSHYDAVTAAGVLLHFGPLDAVMSAVRGHLRTGGIFVFTGLPHPDEGAFGLGPLDGTAEGGTYLHHPDYVWRCATANGFSCLSIRRDVHEYRDDRPREGFVCVLKVD